MFLRCLSTWPPQASIVLALSESLLSAVGCPWTHRGAGADGAAGVCVMAAVDAVVPAAPQHRLQGLDVADGAAQNLHFGQPPLRVGRRAAPQSLKGIVDFAEAPPLPHGRRLPSVRVGRLPLAGLAGPQQAAARLVKAPGGPHMPLLLRFLLRSWDVLMELEMVLHLQQAGVHQLRVQVVKEVHVGIDEAGVVEEVIGGERDRELRQIHRRQRAENTRRRKVVCQLFPLTGLKGQSVKRRPLLTILRLYL